MIDQEAVVRRLDRREGFRIVSFREIGVPLYRLNCGLTLQETSKIGAIEEFIVRAIGQGLTNLEDLVSFLGIPPKIISGQLAQLAIEGSVSVVPGERAEYRLTPTGAKSLAEVSRSRIVRQQLPFYLDGITKRLVAVKTSDLWSNRELAEIGISCAAPILGHAPKAPDIDVTEVNKVIALASRIERPSLRAIRLDAVIGKPTLLFRKAIAMAFKSDDGRRMVIGFAIDGRESEEHELEYERSGKAKDSAIFAQLFDPDRRRRDVQDVRRELSRDVAIEEGAGESTGLRPTLKLTRGTQKPAIASSQVKVLSVYEHPPLLSQALGTAVSRLLIVSPWIRANVVNADFIRRLTECLGRGVRVTIAYGIGKRDSGERDVDRVAREALEALSKSFDNFALVRKGNTHAKVLLVDDSFFVTTSFNWLSFKGDPNQPMREEEGTLVSDPQIVGPYYEKLMSRMAALAP